MLDVNGFDQSLATRALFLIENPPRGIDSWKSRVDALEKRYGSQTYASLLFLLTNLGFSEVEAKAHWQGIVSTWHDLNQVMAGVNLRVAVLHHFLEVQRRLRSPTILERKALQKLRDAVVLDELTQLHNYRFFRDQLDHEVKRSQRYNSSLSLLMIDVDDFKIFNDANGHEKGNHALRKLAHIFVDTVREVDVVTRYGGEEFAVILPATSKGGAFTAAEKIRANVEVTTIPGETSQPGDALTVSIGLATAPADTKDSGTLIQKADEALYSAKSLGKNRVQAYSNERREFPRFNVCLMGKLRVLYRDNAVVNTSNISQTGFLINANRWLPVGGVVHLEFQYGPQRRQLSCIGCVVWVSGRGPEYQTGIRVIHTDSAQLFEYKKFLSQIPASKRLARN